jgi:hypothetical protein
MDDPLTRLLAAVWIKNEREINPDGSERPIGIDLFAGAFRGDAMNTIEYLLKQLQDTASTSAQMDQALGANPNDDVYRVNADAVRKRQNDLERRLNTELRATQSDLVRYHVRRDRRRSSDSLDFNCKQR